MEPLLNPAQELQAIGRVHRIGQSKATCVHRWCTMMTMISMMTMTMMGRVKPRVSIQVIHDGRVSWSWWSCWCWKYVDFLQVSCETDNWGKDPPGTQLDPHCNIVRIHHVAWSKCIVTALNHQNIHKLTHIWCIGRLSYSRRKSTNLRDAIVFAMHSVHSQYWKVIIECIVEVDIHSY